ncbi:arginyl-tRNA synthetase [Buchnera aphidicola (Aphis glycines)]|uniref:Arginine--tRNA ligase n=1 Tax=Buchnera aphidicola (Aphis glycines) TaxID=1265350 RepID=A0A0M4H3G4_9GAMM|nr:arginine--tRNA ligase [Buchnera aphidicola]ALD15201.1 arginyl-tRNA synthetase [Buchnera aphidicola (Aphis glycines)]
MNIKYTIKKDIEQALIKIGLKNYYKPLIISKKKTEFGNYQVDNLMKIAHSNDIEPYILYEKILFFIQKKNIYKKMIFSYPGFINIFINENFLSEKLEELFVSSRLGIKRVDSKKTIVVDYSSPNIAKEMHIGHLRSTIIGDVTVRTLEFLGHNVIRANHIGDWGTQFGMLIAYLKYKKLEKKLQNNLISLREIERFYCKSKKKCDVDKNFEKESKKYVVKLQNGDQHCYSMWKKLITITMKYNYQIYEQLNVTLKKEHTMGESLYNKMLPDIIKDLKEKKIATEKNKAIIIFLNEFKNKLGEPMGVVVQKKDKAFLYSTTDIACLKYRYETLHANRIIYYTDSRQHQHLLQIWTIARKAHYIPQNLLLEHHTFGMMLSKNKRPFKTRDGNTIKLTALLDEAINRAKDLIYQKNPNLPKKKLIKLAKVIGISAVKYSDLSKNRNTNYIFDWDTMLTFEGNTSPYIQYAYTRIISILKKSTIPIHKISEKISLVKNSEIQLATKILEFEEIILIIEAKGIPHIMCNYLYELATYFSNFYENCSILFSKKIKTRKSRLKLSFLTAKTLKKGLNILGIKTLKKM